MPHLLYKADRHFSYFSSARLKKIFFNYFFQTNTKKVTCHVTKTIAFGKTRGIVCFAPCLFSQCGRFFLLYNDIGKTTCPWQGMGMLQGRTTRPPVSDNHPGAARHSGLSVGVAFAAAHPLASSPTFGSLCATRFLRPFNLRTFHFRSCARFKPRLSFVNGFAVVRTAHPLTNAATLWARFPPAPLRATITCCRSRPCACPPL